MRACPPDIRAILAHTFRVFWAKHFVFHAFLLLQIRTYTCLSEGGATSFSASPGVWIMNKPRMMVSIAATLVLLPGVAFAQASNDSPATRAKVTQELRELIGVGYQPDAVWYDYPNDLVAAEKRLDAKRESQGSSTAPTQ
jgi:hypothetical protein